MAEKRIDEGVGDVIEHFLIRFKESQDELVIVITSHLITEFIINKVIEAKSTTAKIILEDKRNYPYSVKLLLIYNMGLIPDDLYHNLTQLNKLRNLFAHNLHPKYSKKYLSFVNPSPFFNEVVCEHPDDPQFYHDFIYTMCTSIATNFACCATLDLCIDISFNST